MTQNNEGAAPSRIEINGNSRNSDQDDPSNYYGFYPNGGCIILEYENGFLCCDCKTMMINNLGDNGSFIYTPINCLTVELHDTNEDGSTNFTCTFSKLLEIKEETEYFENTVYSSFFSKPFILDTINSYDRLADAVIKLIKIHNDNG